MKRTYKIELEIALEREDTPGALGDAVQDLLEGAGFEVTSMACAEPERAPPDLDEFESGVYLCRWPNGDFSIVKADTRGEALFALDEFAAAHSLYLYPLETCLIDFRLNDRGEIELNHFGEETRDLIYQTCYPELDELLYSDRVERDDGGEYSPESEALIREAVERERERLAENQPEGPDAETEAGRELQRQLGTAGPVADHYVRQLARWILKSKTGEGGKPN